MPTMTGKQARRKRPARRAGGRPGAQAGRRPDQGSLKIKGKTIIELSKHVFRIIKWIKIAIISCILKCKCFGSYFNEAHVRSPILAKPLV